jgi:transcriptional regulator with XRE-family HTH domain
VVNSVSFANEVDRHVGRRIRARREALRISQGRLGRQLGVTFSQVQKYEKGSNRIGAGRLYQIAAYLGVSPNYFFEGFGADQPGEAQAENGVSVRPDEVHTLSEAFTSIADEGTRASVLALVKSLVAEARHAPIGR